MGSRFTSGWARVAAVAVCTAALLRITGCLDAGPIGGGGADASLAVTVTALPGSSSGKVAAPDSLQVSLYDVTDSPYTQAPETFPLTASGSWVPEYTDDETGAHFLAELRVDLLEERRFRVVTGLSYDETSPAARARVAGERTVLLAPGDRKNVALVLTPDETPAPEDFGIAVGRSAARPGDRRHGIPIVLKNGSALGGVQFQLRFDEAVIDSVVGIEVDPSSRLYVGAGADSLIGTRFARPTDQTLRVLTIDLRPADGDSLFDPLREIPPGNDLLFLVSVDLVDSYPSLPATVNVSLEDVFFSTPSGSTDIAVTDTTNGVLVVTE